jgi:hypothetical protein
MGQARSHWSPIALVRFATSLSEATRKDKGSTPSVRLSWRWTMLIWQPRGISSALRRHRLVTPSATTLSYNVSATYIDAASLDGPE